MPLSATNLCCFRCPVCAAELQVPIEQRLRDFRCPNCGEIVQIAWFQRFWPGVKMAWSDFIEERRALREESKEAWRRRARAGGERQAEAAREEAGSFVPAAKAAWHGSWRSAANRLASFGSVCSLVAGILIIPFFAMAVLANSLWLMYSVLGLLGLGLLSLTAAGVAEIVVVISQAGWSLTRAVTSGALAMRGVLTRLLAPAGPVDRAGKLLRRIRGMINREPLLACLMGVVLGALIVLAAVYFIGSGRDRCPFCGAGVAGLRQGSIVYICGTFHVSSQLCWYRTAACIVSGKPKDAPAPHREKVILMPAYGLLPAAPSPPRAPAPPALPSKAPIDWDALLAAPPGK